MSFYAKNYKTCSQNRSIGAKWVKFKHTVEFKSNRIKPNQPTRFKQFEISLIFESNLKLSFSSKLNPSMLV